MTTYDAYRAFATADEDWHRELARQFGRHAGDARYEPRGKGEPGTALRTAFDARMAAFYAYEKAKAQ